MAWLSAANPAPPSRTSTSTTSGPGAPVAIATFRPGYGHLAAQVGPCWEQHDLCLYQLAWLSEMHTAIFLAPERLLPAEADWHTRLLPAAVALMAEETDRCDHLHRKPGADPWARAS